MQFYKAAARENERPRWILSLGNAEATRKVVSRVILIIISSGEVPPIWQATPTSAHRQTNWPAGAQERARASLSQEGKTLARLRSRTRPRSLSSPAGPEPRAQGAPGGEGARRGQVAADWVSHLTMLRNQDGRLRRPRSWARVTPARDAGSPPPRAERKQPRRGAGAPGLGAARLRARCFRSCAVSAYRCGGRGARARVTAPPAWPPSGLQTRCWQRAESAKEEAPRLDWRVRTKQTRQGETPAPRLPLLQPPELGGPRVRRVRGATGGLGCVDAAGRGGTSFRYFFG